VYVYPEKRGAINRRDLFRSQMIPTCSMFIRHDLVKIWPSFLMDVMGLDYCMQLYLANKGDVYYISSTMGAYRYGSGTWSRGSQVDKVIHGIHDLVHLLNNLEGGHKNELLTQLLNLIVSNNLLIDNESRKKVSSLLGILNEFWLREMFNSLVLEIYPRIIKSTSHKDDQEISQLIDQLSKKDNLISQLQESNDILMNTINEREVNSNEMKGAKEAFERAYLGQIQELKRLKDDLKIRNAQVSELHQRIDNYARETKQLDQLFMSELKKTDS